MRVAVIGAGIVGAAVGQALARRDVDVTLYERHHPGAGTSATTFAWTNSHDKRPESYYRLNLEGCAEHARLAAQSASGGRDRHGPANSGVPQWHFPTGNLVWADDADEQAALERRVQRLDGLDYPCRWLEPADVRRLEPDVRVPRHVERIAYFPAEGYVLPMLLLAYLLGEARARGAVLRYPVTVAAIEPDARGVEVVLEDGARERFDRVVGCVGRWTEALAATAGARVPMADPEEAGGPAVGVLAYTAALPARLTRVVTSSRLNVRPDGGGRLVLQGRDLDSGADPAKPPGPGWAEAATLAARLGELFALGDAATVESVRVGQRALPADGLTVAGFAGEHERFYVLCTHSGVTLGPLLGRLTASEIADDAAAGWLTGFRPDRFRAAGDTVTVTPVRALGEQ